MRAVFGSSFDFSARQGSDPRKAADHRNAGISDRSDAVVGPKDHITGTFDGAKEGQPPGAKQVQVAKRRDWRQSSLAKWPI